MEEKKFDYNKKIEIVKGNSKNLEISDVKDNLTFEEHSSDSSKKGKIIIPQNSNPDEQ